MCSNQSGRHNFAQLGLVLASTLVTLWQRSLQRAASSERANWSKLPVSELKATLIYDGACGVCRWWVGYWQQLTGGQVLYRAYQEAADDFPEIPRDALARAIWLVEPNGSRCSAAAATFRLLSFAPGHGGWWWAYRRLPGFAPATERAYAVLAKRRGALAALTRLMWGSVPTPSRHALISWAFLKGLGAIYVAAFASLTVQVLGLVGQSGILPLSEDLAAARQAWGAAAYWRMPTLFWLDSSDSALVTATVIGIVVGILIIAGRLVTPALIAGYVLYLSLVYAGQIFLDYQWDQLLLEAGFLGIFLATGPPIVIWLYRWLLFRFIFLAGLMKLVSGDPTWRQLTALDYHFWTQPLPTPLAWYAAQLPRIGLAGATAAVLVIELVLVFLALLPRRPRCLAAAAILLLQLAIMATGNYGFFNLLTILLCLPLLDDAALSRLIPPRVVLRMHAKTAPPGRTAITAATILALVVVPLGIRPNLAAIDRHRSPHDQRTDANSDAATDRQSLRAVRNGHDNQTGTRLRRLRRRQGLARICLPLRTWPRRPGAALEHSLPTASRLAELVRKLRQCLIQPLGGPLRNAPA